MVFKDLICVFIIKFLMWITIILYEELSAIEEKFSFLLVFAILLTGCKNSFSDYGKNNS